MVCVCQKCSKKFVRPKSQLFCSRACSGGRGAIPQHPLRVCEHCELEFRPKSRQTSQRFCTRACYKASGMRHVNKQGYVEIWVGKDHPTAWGNGQMLEHRHVMEQKLGRLLGPRETVHHINGDKADNRSENLELWHTRHPKGVRDDEVPHCPTCRCADA